MKTIETVGKDIEQALKAGLAELGCKLDDVDVKILEHPGIFRKARVRMTCHIGDETVEKKTAAAVMRNLEERAARVAGNNDRGKRGDGRNKNDRRDRPEPSAEQRPQPGRERTGQNNNTRADRANAPKERPAAAPERPERKPADADGQTERPQKSEFRRDFRAELEAANIGGGAPDEARKSEKNERTDRGERRKPEPAREYASPEALEAARGKIADYLRQLTGLMGMPSDVTTEIKDNGVEAVLTAEEENLVGARGETLEALEYLATLAVSGGDSRQVRVNLDCGGYRKRLEGDIARSATEAADKAAATGRRVEMPPMSSSARRVVHATLGNREDVITRSEGREPNRYIVIIPKRAGDRPNGGNYGNRRPNGNGGYNGNYKKNNNKHWNNHGRKNAGGKDSGAE